MLDSIRATTRKELDILTEKVNQIASGAAIQTGCDYEFGLYKMV